MPLWGHGGGRACTCGRGFGLVQVRERERFERMLDYMWARLDVGERPACDSRMTTVASYTFKCCPNPTEWKRTRAGGSQAPCRGAGEDDGHADAGSGESRECACACRARRLVDTWAGLGLT